MQVLGLEHIDLSVADLQRSAAFYSSVLEALGFARFEHPVGHVSWSNGMLSITLRPCARDRARETFDRYRIGLHHLALKLKDRNDVNELHDLLVREDYRVLDSPAEYSEYGPDYYAVFFEDPDGLKLEAVHYPWGYWKRVQTDGEDSRARHTL